VLAVVAAAAVLAAGGSLAARVDSNHAVGLILSSPAVNRGGDPVIFDAFVGLVRAHRKLGVRVKAVTPSPGPGPNDLAPYDFLARRGYDLVISPAFIPGITQAARRFPSMKVVSLDGTRGQLDHPAPNIEGTIFHTEQAGYLAGFVAARMADLRFPAPHVVSAVGGDPKEVQVVAYIAGFQAGARRADPKIRVLKAYSHDFIDTARCKHAALLQIAHGSQAVFDVAGDCGLGALAAAKQEGVFGVGVDTDQSYLGKFILTSALKNLNFAVYDLAKRLVHGRLPTGGNLRFDLRDHGVGLGRFSPLVPRSVRRALIPLSRQIEQGKIVVPATLSSAR